MIKIVVRRLKLSFEVARYVVFVHSIIVRPWVKP
jgi:hypothetical protein